MIRTPDALHLAQSPVEMRLTNLVLSPGQLAFAGVAAYRELLEALRSGEGNAGLYPGAFDMTLTHPFNHEIADGTYGFDQLAQQTPLATGVHQAWPESLPTMKARGASFMAKVVNLAARCIMPETRGSLKQLPGVAKTLGANVACVYLGQTDKNGNLLDMSEIDAPTAVQIFPEHVRDFAMLETGKYFKEALAKQGITGFVIDPSHLLRAANDDPAFRLNANEVLRVLATCEEAGIPLLGLHASTGRTDSKHERDVNRSMRELGAVFEGAEAIADTDAGKVLAEGLAIWRRQQEARQQELWKEERASTARLAADPTLMGRDGQLDWPKYFAALADNPDVQAFRQYGLDSLPPCPVTVETTHRALRQQAGRRWWLPRAIFVDQLQTLGHNWQAFFAAQV